MRSTPGPGGWRWPGGGEPPDQRHEDEGLAGGGGPGPHDHGHQRVALVETERQEPLGEDDVDHVEDGAHAEADVRRAIDAPLGDAAGGRWI